MSRKRYALCGLSTRSIYHFALPILAAGQHQESSYPETCELVGILDLDADRVGQFLKNVNHSIPVYGAGEMEKMVRETGAEVVLVGTPDYLHCENTVAALDAGCDVVVEKPMVITSEEIRKVREAERRSGRHVVVTFNYRYNLHHQIIKRMLVAGKIGRITSVEFTYNLDTEHGSSYFYRWNRERAKSGGLNIHKCCHHFDLINWFLGDLPEEVFAFGRRNYYGSEGGLRPRDAGGEALDRVAEKRACPVFQKHYAGKFSAEAPAVSTDWDAMKLPYASQYPEDEPRYIYDDQIDIEDTYSAVVRYAGGASLAYSCNFCTPWEGYTLGINGTAGRIEAEHRSNPDPTGLTESRERTKRVTLLPLFGGREEIEIPEAAGGHDGADPLIRNDLFAGVSDNSRELGLLAGSREGGIAVALGEAVWLSIRDHKPIHLDPAIWA